MTVKIKPLAWENFGALSHWADSVVGVYRVEFAGGVWSWTKDDDCVYLHGESAETEESAKAAAQADYEARILSAIEAVKLKPCPFCGGEAHHFTSHQDSDSQEIVQCRICGAEIGFWLPWTADGKEKASAEESVICRWNTRADRIDMDVLARVEALRDIAATVREWRNDVPMTGEECANAILALIDKEQGQ